MGNFFTFDIGVSKFTSQVSTTHEKFTTNRDFKKFGTNRDFKSIQPIVT